ncbi:antitoxin [Saccharolobus solfataricus]|uniref:Antitoxin n=3 Tax=Saccharolobus solfataricus TaxID=2287 RepID=A0A0E3GVK9_SACSO|nr:antitoxin [Saccharolobus solfataricus]AKA77501.1 antitoxin [Saccharolobus solfataricus]AKA80191.1 antitoxin [Saccharolobus solfataricus]AZF69275.1 antitoxin [Saccharolobus solfataricus]AZF71895.1 antitoxin [Saccharolobus solfataricus]
MFTIKENTMTSTVISIRVDERLKKELEELGIDYPELVRRYLEEVVRKEKMRRELREANGIREELLKSHGYYSPSAELVREDRDGYH